MGQFAVAAGFRRQIDDDRPTLHVFHHRRGDDLRRGPTRNGGGGDDRVGGGDVFGRHIGLLLLFFRRQFTGVTALGGRVDAGVDHLGAQRFDFLTGRWADVVGFHHGAQPLGGGDGLQTGHAGADNDHLGRADGAGGGGEHREKPAGQAGGAQRHEVAGHGGLGGQHVHRLSTGDAWNQLHGEAGDLLVAQALDHVRVTMRRQHGQQNRTVLERLHLFQSRPLYLEDHIGLGIQRLGAIHQPAAFTISFIGEESAETRAFFHQDLHAELGETLGHRRVQRDPLFARNGFLRDGHTNRHDVVLLIVIFTGLPPARKLTRKKGFLKPLGAPGC